MEPTPRHSFSHVAQQIVNTIPDSYKKSFFKHIAILGHQALALHKTLQKHEFKVQVGAGALLSLLTIGLIAFAIKSVQSALKKDPIPTKAKDANPDPNHLEGTLLAMLPEELFLDIAKQMDTKELIRQKDHKPLWQKEVIRRINEQKIPLKEAFSNLESALNYISAHGNALEYADFTGFQLKETDLQKLLNICPNIKHLSIPSSTITNLAFLQKTPELQSLNIANCSQLHVNALDNLKHVKNLQSLNITGCVQLAANALDNLKHVKNLQSLNITGCVQLAANALDNLFHVPGLQSLNITRCFTLHVNALDNLKHVKNLQSLIIAQCDQLDANALENLQHVPGLQSLNIDHCGQLAANALDNLFHVPGLQSLNITNCSQLDENALANLKYIPKLQHLYATLDTITWMNLKSSNPSFTIHQPPRFFQ